MRNKERIRQLLGGGTEMAIMLFLVSIFFAALTILLFRMFPLGITLSQILEKKSGSRSLERGSSGGIMLDLKDQGGTEQAAAVLSQLGNDVRSKGAASIAWGPAQQGMRLRDRDAVQTFTQSSARINFDSTNYLTMGSNSLVIIKRIEKEVATQERRSAVVVVGGQLQGHVAAAGQNPLKLNIATPSAAVRMLPGGKAVKAEFKISVNPDHSSTIVVFRGEAAVSAQGKTVQVSENSGLTVKHGEAPGAATRLPEPPAQVSPAEGSVVAYRDLPQRVRFSWTPPAKGCRYHLQLARDRGFREVVLDRVLDEPEFLHGNLRKGGYFWRVSALAEGVEGVPGKTSRFEVRQSLAPPLLQVTFPSGPVAEERFLLVGSTTEGNRIFVGGSPVPTDGRGSFSHAVALRPGMNLVTVEAVDPSGNVSYRSSYVQGRF